MARVRELLFETDTEWIEIISMTSALLFSVRVLFPELVTSEDVRAGILLSVSPRPAWSIVFFALVMLHGLALFRYHHLRRAASFVASLLWFAAGGAAAFIAASGFSTYIVLALALGWSHIRLSLDGL